MFDNAKYSKNEKLVSSHRMILVKKESADFHIVMIMIYYHQKNVCFVIKEWKRIKVNEDLAKIHSKSSEDAIKSRAEAIQNT